MGAGAGYVRRASKESGDTASQNFLPAGRTPGTPSGMGPLGLMPTLLMLLRAGVRYCALVMITPEPSSNGTIVWIKPLPNVPSPRMAARPLSCKRTGRGAGVVAGAIELHAGAGAGVASCCHVGCREAGPTGVGGDGRRTERPSSAALWDGGVVSQNQKWTTPFGRGVMIVREGTGRRPVAVLNNRLGCLCRINLTP